jgi:ankyrin repeat protein
LAAIVILPFAWWFHSSNRLTAYAENGDLAGVRLCLWFGTNPNQPCRWGWPDADGQTPLTAAAQFGRVEVVEVLLKWGANPNLRDSGSDYPHETPLSTAAMQGQLEVCRVLLKAGADPNVPTNPRQPGDPGNWTALDWALQAQQSDVAKALRGWGAVEGGRKLRQ